jgi:hypothetical protein
LGGERDKGGGEEREREREAISFLSGLVPLLPSLLSLSGLLHLSTQLDLK